MSRKKREWYPGATYHVMSRGNRRTALFKDDSDYIRFLECIEKTKTIYNYKIHSMCLMTNHFHMIIETEDKELWKIMQRMLHPYSMDFNHRYNFTGHLFESRYVACLIENEKYFLEASRYIHLNPVKAAMVREPLAFEYSSYSSFVGRNGLEAGKEKKQAKSMIDGMTETSRVLSCFHNNSREQYRMFVEGKISHEEQEMLIQKDIKEDEMWLPW
ncbi:MULTISPECIES: transposase [Butyrivibrio]|uniref:transposase n=1 Tax=Butyrivibrio TaxID=830 RepID=UPI00047CC55E|nr:MULTISPECIES: transposase [Butyrivibrio]SCY76454.1 REP element-mobilizing transposase RayT [Butyrivibrio sp. INlla14]